MAPAPAPVNPYEPPRALDPSAPGGPERAPGEWVKWGYGGLAVASTLACVALLFPKELSLSPAAQQSVVAVVNGPIHWGKFAFALLWIHRAWSGLPLRARGETSPAMAVAAFFAPIYNVYWTFVVNARLCFGLDGVLVAAGERERAPVALARVAPFVQFGTSLISYAMLQGPARGYAFLVVTAQSATWVLYMFECDRARRAVARAVARGAVDESTLAPPTRPMKPGTVVLVCVGTLLGLFCFLGVWQFLSPGTEGQHLLSEPRP
jgi:hypothetical protein